MKRRSWLRALVSLAFVATGLGSRVARAAGGSGPPAATRRRVRPSDPAWPSAADWESLKERVGGNLVRVQPVLAPCAADRASQPCKEVLANLRNPFFLGDQPAGTQLTGWLDAWSPAPSVYAVAATTAADVAAAVDFARQKRLRLVVKGGGHSYQGTSNAADSLLVWTRKMNSVTLLDDFVPQGCERIARPCPAVRIGAGAMWADAYDAVTTRAGRYVQGGGCTSVGVAGLVQSGGFGSCSKGFGTAAASLLEAEIVTADGAIRTVNAARDPELFWALKGGGGGSWGVVTQLTLRTHALPVHFGSVGGSIQAKSDAAFRELIDRFLAFYRERLLNPHWGESVKIRPENVLEVSMVSQGLDDREMDAAWQPFLDWARASGDLRTVDVSVGSGSSRQWWDVEARRKRGSDALFSDPRPGAPVHHAWWRGDGEQVSAYIHAYDSLWLQAGLLDSAARGRLAEALLAASRHFAVELHFNKGLAGASPESLGATRDTATNPAVLEAFALAIIATGGAPPLAGPAFDGARAQRNRESVGRSAAALRALDPDAGSYVSESDYFNPRWREAFWGGNYRRLRAAKEAYDPDGLFFVHHGVGSEDWSTDGFDRIA